MGLNYLLKFLKYAHEVLASVQITVRLYSSPATVCFRITSDLPASPCPPSPPSRCVVSRFKRVMAHVWHLSMIAKLHVKQLPGAEHTATHRFLLFSSDDTVVFSRDRRRSKAPLGNPPQQPLTRRHQSCPLPSCVVTFLWTDDQGCHARRFAL